MNYYPCLASVSRRSPYARHVSWMFAGILSLITGTASQAQWIAYTFSPQAAYRDSYGLTTNTAASTPAMQANGWPSDWNDPSRRGLMAVYFSTNTNQLNIVAFLPPLIYSYSRTGTNSLSTNNYTNLPHLAFTNTNTAGISSLADPLSFFGRMKFGTAQYAAGNFSCLTSDTNNEAMTNLSGYFWELCTPFRTNAIGTNGVPTNGSVHYYPSLLS